MYHELTQERIKSRRRARIISLVVTVVLAVVCGLAVNAYRRSALEQGAASVREAILESANHCCAVEGSYPTSLGYLERNYGLVVNHNDYVITYEAYAGNVAPTVVVIPR
ncbi:MULTISPECIES: hypothetical protein [Atopobiaceae]|uniref:Uncharacterized protein n=1 Tax=Parafannyhessea umbonata TaxID=604330 RepID=A0A1H9Q1E7_9ACTN|nr:MULTISPECIES: hypothetical protein [Atopobiaceae]SEH48389.1 hypothetical protein SAMN05216447_103127 [Parafannyhessea umbonata]SER54281.1 hypothetical protein SAMN05216446_1250 [Parafannyhessea umbonata]SJZ67546.1 hypothetical protein SAMN06298223_1075 [Olsenella sp. KH1P3]